MKGNWCDVSRLKASTCKSEKHDQAKCSDNFECQSGYCTGKVCASEGQQPEGAHCKKGDCLPSLYCSISLLGTNKCVPKLDNGAKCAAKNSFQCASGECRNGICVGSARPGTRRRRRRLLALEGETRHAMRKAAMRRTMVRIKQLQQLATLARAADKIDRAFAQKQLMNAKMVSSLVTGMVSFMHAHTDKLKAHTQGVAVLPNACVSEETIGTSFSIAINVENPSLLKWAWGALKKLPAPSVPLPEILAAIMPLINANQISDPKCLAAAAARTAAVDRQAAKAPDAEGSFGRDPDAAREEEQEASAVQGR